ncbi:Cystathionine gamma-synthase (EC [Olavius sp. associated proteobacterium Delta 1]|nr:Cystathionine gamma-synthase (EC [Olavius sp. associated proteobacterium Delta 1]
MKTSDGPKSGTLSVWAGEGGPHWQRSNQVPVVHRVSFGYDDLDEWLRVGQGQASGHIYGRNTNPTVQAFEEKVRILEGAEAATSFASGMAAVSNTLFTLLSPGDRVVSIKDSYGGTNKLFIEFLPRFQIEAAAPEIRPPGRQSGSGRDHRRSTGHHQSCGVHQRRTGCHGHPRRSGALFRGH